MNMKTILLAAALFAASLSTAVAINNYAAVGSDKHAASIFDVPTATSFTGSITKGLFSTDVDDYMNVNDFRNVQPEKLFAFFGYNYRLDDDLNRTSGSNNGFNIGFAKQFSPFFMGAYFGGHLDGFKMTSVFNDAPGANKSDYTYVADAQFTYTGAVLMGFEKFAVKASLLYDPRNGIGYLHSTSDDEIRSDVWRLYTAVQVGLNHSWAPHFELGIDSHVARFYQKSAGSADRSFYDVYLRGGVTQPLADVSEKYAHEFSYDADTRWRIYPLVWNENNDMRTEKFGLADHLIQLTAAYKATVTPLERVTFKMKVALPFEVGWKFDAYSIKTVTKDDNNTSYESPRNYYTDIGFVPTFAVGATFAVIPNRFQLNFGTEFKIGELGWNIHTVDTMKDSGASSSKSSTQTDVSFGFDPDNFGTDWGLGLTVFFGRAISLDARYNILQAVNNTIKVQEIKDATFEFLVTVKM